MYEPLGERREGVTIIDAYRLMTFAKVEDSDERAYVMLCCYGKTVHKLVHMTHGGT